MLLPWTRLFLTPPGPDNFTRLRREEVEITDQSCAYGKGSDSFKNLESEVDYVGTKLGTAGAYEGSAVFVGYGIESGPDNYSSYGDFEDFEGKAAIMLRFEPMDEEGDSLWTRKGRWTGYSSLASKIRSAARRNAGAIFIINTVGASDDRINSLEVSADRSWGKVPVFFISVEAGVGLLEFGDQAGRTAMDIRKFVDNGGLPFELSVLVIKGNVSLDRKPLIAEKVIAKHEGRGDLADEVVVIGAHLDHLGMGAFGSRAEGGSGKFHPGADDNASGAAALILLGQRLKADYLSMVEGQSARTILFIAFSGEESGLNGSRAYVDDPVMPIEDHVLMINFDMIGRIIEDRLSVSGANTGEGMSEWLAPFFEESSLDVRQTSGLNGASDHTSFYEKEVPVLFGIIHDFHDDYHTPEDVQWKINRKGAIQTVDLFHKITRGIATRSESFDFVSRQRGRRQEAQRGGIKVRFGIQPGSYEEETGGILVGRVFEDTSASEAGLKEGDVIIAWAGEMVRDVPGWMEMLREHEPGDEVLITVMRADAKQTLKVTMRSR